VKLPAPTLRGREEKVRNWKQMRCGIGMRALTLAPDSAVAARRSVSTEITLAAPFPSRARRSR